MKINFNNVSFKRIIPVQSNIYDADNPRKEKKAIKQVLKASFEDSSKVYTQEQADKIRSFFETSLIDFDVKDGLLIKKTEDGQLYLISGKDVKKINSYEKKSDKLKVEKYIKTKSENGDYNKAQSVIKFNFVHAGNGYCLKNINYIYSHKDYSKDNDGSVNNRSKKVNRYYLHAPYANVYVNNVELSL